MDKIKKHIEWLAFFAGMILLALMDPDSTGMNLCLFEHIGINFCPGHGLGHSIAYTFRGEVNLAFNAHFFGPPAVLILTGRIIYLWKTMILNNKPNITENIDG